MLFIAVALKLGYVVSPSLEAGAFVVYRFFASVMTYPLPFAIGVSLTPWGRLVAVIALPNIVTVLATVAILKAANRRALVPFAQIATRIDGAITVTLALILLTRFT